MDSKFTETKDQNLRMEKEKIFLETVSPNIYVDDIEKTISFYKVLGFQLLTTVPDKGKLIFALMKFGNVNFMFQTFESIKGTLPEISRKNGGSILLYVQMKGIRPYFEQVKKSIPIYKGLDTTFYGATEFSILDNNNYLITFAEDE